jgi:hypothetical protein
MVRFQWKTVVVAMVIALIGVGTSYSQAKQDVATLKPRLALSEVAFAAQMLETIEIRGSEVDAFVDIKKVFMGILEIAQKDKKEAKDVVTVEMNIGQAQNLLTLLQRAKLTGADAERYKKFVDVIIASAQPEGKK